jgi:membrane protein
MEQSLIDRVRSSAEWLCRFVVYVGRRLGEQQGFQIAASLAYTTLLSLVPLLTIMFALPDVFPGSARFGEMIQEFVFNNLVPEVGVTVRAYLREFSLNASRLTLTGLTLLIIIALMLMSTIDNALNRIWRVRRRRAPAGRFVIYWAMITLGPLLVGFGLVSTSYLLSLPVVTEVDSALRLQARLLSALPFLTTTTAFTLLYALVPHCRVAMRDAAWGGLAAAVLFELAKIGFGYYVRSANSEQIYGALAVLPLFLVWIYTSWVIVLFGAHLTYSLGEVRDAAIPASTDAGRGWGFAEAFGVLRALWLAQQTGGVIGPRDTGRWGARLAPGVVQEIIDCFAAGRWVEETASGAWMLSRDLETMTLLDFHRLVPRRLPLEAPEAGRDLHALEPVLAGYRFDLDARMNIPLGRLLRAAG